MKPDGFAIVVYDLRNPTAWQAARRHRAAWGRLYTDIVALDLDHIALVFRPAPDEGWRPWELVRLSWILDEDLEGIPPEEGGGRGPGRGWKIPMHAVHDRDRPVL